MGFTFITPPKTVKCTGLTFINKAEYWGQYLTICVEFWWLSCNLIFASCFIIVRLNRQFDIKREGEWEQTYQIHVADWKEWRKFLIWPIKQKSLRQKNARVYLPRVTGGDWGNWGWELRQLGKRVFALPDWLLCFMKKALEGIMLILRKRCWAFLKGFAPRILQLESLAKLGKPLW